MQLQSQYFLKTPHILKKINILFIVHFCLGKYSISLDMFWSHLILRKKLTLHSFFISVLVNTVSVSSFLTYFVSKREIKFYSFFISVLVNTASVSIFFSMHLLSKRRRTMFHSFFIFILVNTACFSLYTFWTHLEYEKKNECYEMSWEKKKIIW